MVIREGSVRGKQSQMQYVLRVVNVQVTVMCGKVPARLRWAPKRSATLARIGGQRTFVQHRHHNVVLFYDQGGRTGREDAIALRDAGPSNTSYTEAVHDYHDT